MNPLPFPGLSKTLAPLRCLARAPHVLLLVLLATNALARPYSGIRHDARLYSVQVVNRAEPGLYADDLFFRYGSQDRYSLFAPVLVPLHRLFGVETAFFLVYLASNVLLFWAMKGVVERLVGDRALSTLALLIMSIVPLDYAGMSTFHIHEPFLTP